MCRFLLYVGDPLTLGTLITEPEHSLIRQSSHSQLRSEALNGDGFGVAWYVHDISPEPARFRSFRPAWNCANLRDIARVSRSSVVLAHVRAASPGLEISESNCHPFAEGKLAFMHNGSIGGFLKKKRELQKPLSDRAFDSITGSTDSELAFAHFQDFYNELESLAGVERLAAAMTKTIERILSITDPDGDPSYLNFAVSDGFSAVVSKYSNTDEQPSLFLSRGRSYRCENGVCLMDKSDDTNAAIIVASEPLSLDDGWEEVPSSSLVLINADRQVEIRPILQP
ncbi:MAG: glutamine amidotransferase [Planctomycetota bacterium]|jgi:glutamine amidotransferase